MHNHRQLKTFINPKNITVIGASERPGAWGSFIMESLLTWKFPGNIYPVNPKAKTIYGIPAFPDIKAVPDPVDLAVIAIPVEFLETTVKACGKKGYRGVTIITAGLSEAVTNGLEREKALTEMAGSYGMRLLGPNVSGTFNLHACFNASGSPANFLFPTSLAGICQGGYAIYDLMSSVYEKKMGIGKFIHTGNECDTTVTDFLEYFGDDEEVKGIIMYLETLRDGDRFFKAASKIAQKKPIIIHKAGRTQAGSRAASSHTGALACRQNIFEAAFKQANIIFCPTMELLIPMADALIERPPLLGSKVGIITMGGSWGVALSDVLEENGLSVPQFSQHLRQKLTELGMPERASTKNPVDIGAAGAMSFSPETLLQIGRAILTSGEVNSLIVHGFGRSGFLDKNIPQSWKEFTAMEISIMEKFSVLEKELDFPVILGCSLTLWESESVHDITKKGIRTFNRLDDIAGILSKMYLYYKHKLKKIKGHSSIS